MVWAIVKWGIESIDTTLVVALPLATSLLVYVGLGLLLPERRPDVDELVDSLTATRRRPTRSPRDGPRWPADSWNTVP
ncbi:hypothetical protein [Kribbella sp. NPDC050470]|uniref:hypothetical protein n=1 Tax=unclassified Kribbella TaxID=2644121 RepID=UPI0037B3B769